MKQVQQNYRSGELKVADVPAPAYGAGELLVATRVSLISSGTERQLMQLAKSSLVGKAAARPDLVRRVLVNVKKEGLRPTIEKVFAKLDMPIPLALIGTSSLIWRNTNPRPGQYGGDPDPFNTSHEELSAWLHQGADAGKGEAADLVENSKQVELTPLA